MSPPRTDDAQAGSTVERDGCGRGPWLFFFFSFSLCLSLYALFFFTCISWLAWLV